MRTTRKRQGAARYERERARNDGDRVDLCPSCDPGPVFHRLCGAYLAASQAKE